MDAQQVARDREAEPARVLLADDHLDQLREVVAELDQAGKASEAAEGYLTFGRDASCGKADANFTARALYRAGVLFFGEKKKAKAKEAFEAASKVQGVTDTVAKSQVEDAKKRLKGL